MTNDPTNEIILLGAGASVEAGIPAAFDMTKKLIQLFGEYSKASQHANGPRSKGIELQAYLGTSAVVEVSGSGHTVFAQKTPATFAAGQCSNMIRLHARKWLPVVRTSSTNKT